MCSIAVTGQFPNVSGTSKLAFEVYRAVGAFHAGLYESLVKLER